MTSGRRVSLLVLTGLLLAAHPGWAQAVGEVINVEGAAHIKNGAPVATGHELETKQGKLSVYFPGDRTPGQLGLAPGTRVRIVEPSRRREGKRIAGAEGESLVGGGMQVAMPEGEGLVGGGMQVALLEGEGLVSGSLDVRTGRQQEVEVLHQGTEFLVSYQEATGRVQVVGVSGQVEVRTPAGRLTAGAYEVIVVEPGRAPRQLPRLADSELAQRLAVFRFIGRGEAQSQVPGYPLLVGKGLKAEDRATWLTVPMARDERRRFPDPPVDTHPTAVDLSIQF